METLLNIRRLLWAPVRFAIGALLWLIGCTAILGLCALTVAAVALFFIGIPYAIYHGASWEVVAIIAGLSYMAGFMANALSALYGVWKSYY